MSLYQQGQPPLRSSYEGSDRGQPQQEQSAYGSYTPGVANHNNGNGTFNVGPPSYNAPQLSIQNSQAFYGGQTMQPQTVYGDPIIQITPQFTLPSNTYSKPSLCHRSHSRMRSHS
jgi:hypothetical protein